MTRQLPLLAPEFRAEIAVPQFGQVAIALFCRELRVKTCWQSGLQSPRRSFSGETKPNSIRVLHLAARKKNPVFGVVRIIRHSFSTYL